MPAPPPPPDAATAPAAEDPAALLTRLEWTVLRRLDGLLQGDHRTLWRGAGLDLADLREYQPGDDVRHIDWNVSARLQTPHVRQFTEDRELTAWFLVDLSGSMGFGSTGRSKQALAEAVVAALARLLTRHGNRVGALLYRPAAATPLTVLPPGAGRGAVLRLIAALRAPVAPAAGDRAPRPARRGATPPAPPPTRLAELLDRAAGVLRRRGLLFVLSDFISEPGWAAPLGRLARRHELLAVRLLDPAELDLPPLGLLTVADAETGEQLLVDTGDPGFRQRYAALAAAHEQALQDALAGAGADVLELATGDDLLATLLRYVALRRQRARAGAHHRLPAAASAEPAGQALPA